MSTQILYTEPVPSMQFTTAENVLKFLNKEAFTDQESAIISMLIPQIDGVVRNYCGWEVTAKDYTEKLFDGTGGYTLDLKSLPLNELSELLIDGEDYTDVVSANQEDGELFFTTSDGITFTSGTRNISATYNSGYLNVPTDLDFAAAWLVALFFSRIDLENLGVAEEQFNAAGVKYDPTDLPVLVKHTLDRYRRIGIY